jgi:hypothetical protein
MVQSVDVRALGSCGLARNAVMLAMLAATLGASESVRHGDSAEWLVRFVSARLVEGHSAASARLPIHVSRATRDMMKVRAPVDSNRHAIRVGP